MTPTDQPPHAVADLPDRAALADALADACVLRGRFTLRSGRESGYYLDKYRFTTRPELLGPHAALIAAEVDAIGADAAEGAAEGAGVDRLAGAELGGVPLVTAVALRTGAPTVLVRNAKKDYGTAQRLEGVLEAGDRAVLIEDVATTGGQAVEAVAVLRDAGAEVLGVVVTVDREEGAAEAMAGAGVRYRRVFTKTDLGIDE